MRRYVVLGVAAALAASTFAALAPGGTSETASPSEKGGTGKLWRVTIENLTPEGPGAPGAQPLSPPLFVVHSTRADVWSVGEIASHGVAAIAEDANNAPLASALGRVREVKAVFTGEGGPIPSGASRTFTVRTSGKANRLTILTMLVNTNDAFTGLDSFHVRGHVDRRSLRTTAYDAGSEKNDELEAHIPGPCCGNAFARNPEGRLIRMHPGLTGRGDLDPSVYGWEGPVAKITIERAS